jgi:hypothetical protein
MAAKRQKEGMLSRVAAAARRALRFGEADEGGPVAAPVAASPVDALVEDSFHLVLKQMLDEDEGDFNTRLHVVSLVEFREAVGDKWKRISEKVMLIAEGIINKHLGTGNVCGRRGQDLFILVFRGISAEEGRRRAVVIAEELGSRLLGSQFTGSERPLALAAELSVTDGINPDGSINLAAVHNAVGEMRAIIADAAEDDRLPLELPDESPLSHSALPGPLPKLEPVLPRQVKPLPSWAEAPRAPRGSKDPGWEAMAPVREAGHTPPPSAPPLPAGAALSLLYRPTWVAAGESIGAYKAHIQRVDSPGRPALEGALAYPRSDAASAHSLDRFAIAQAVRDGLTAELAGMTPILLVPMHWATATSASRISLTEPFATMPEATRRGRVVIDLFGVPDGASGGVLTEVIRALKPLCRAVLLRAQLPDSRAAVAAAAGAAMVGVDLSELFADERTDDARLLAALVQFREATALAGVGAYVWGVRRRAVIVGAVTGGFAMVNGPGLMKDLARPAKVLPAPKARFSAA